MLTALRPSSTWASIQARYGSHAEVVVAAGGRGGGICPAGTAAPVATPGDFACRW